MVLRMKNSIILGVHWKNPTFRGEGGGGGGSRKTNIDGGGSLKRGAWTVCRFNGGLGKKEGGWYPIAHYDTPYIISNAGFF